MTTKARIASVLDRTWVRQSFMLSADKVDGTVKEWRMYCSADSKFTSSRLGGNFVVNPVPQYTPYADIRRKGLLKEHYTDQSFETGMGHYYSEQIDDNMIMATFRFGVAEYNGMFSFFTGFYDNEAATLANQGLVSKAFYAAGRLAGVIFTIRFWPLLAISAIGGLYRFGAGMPASKYYYLNPTMYPYWQRVNNIASTLAVNLGVVPRVRRLFNDYFSKEEVPPSALQYFHDMDPEIFLEKGGIDVYALATKAQRMANRRFTAFENRLKESQTPDDYYTQMRQFMTDYGQAGLTDDQFGNDPGKVSLTSYLDRYHGTAWGDTTRLRTDALAQALEQDAAAVGGEGGGENSQQAQIDSFNDLSRNLRPVWDYKYIDSLEKETVKETNPQTGLTEERVVGVKGYDESQALKKQGWWSQVGDQFVAEYRDGGQFISFRVDNPGTVQESFSNSAGESQIAGKLNGVTNSARSMRFNFSDGNTGVGVVDEVFNAVKSFAAGALDSLHVSGIMSLAGAAWVDIPKVYESSSASFPSASYTIQLRSPYGNKMSRFINLYVPLSMLLAATLPISTGKQSYTGPFLCEMYSRGRNAIRLGMITSLSITRGVGTLGWNNDDEPLGIDVSFEVTDFSTVMHAPIDSRQDSLLPWKGLMDDDNAFNDYMSVLSSMSLEDMVYPFNKLLINATRKVQTHRAFGTGAQVGSWLGHKMPGRILSAIAANPEVSINR